MDNAVALVQAYLRINGYFTVAEYPVVEAMKQGGYRVATDLDILAFRFSGAGRLVPGPKGPGTVIASPDPALKISSSEADMLIGEVKEGRAELNAAATDPTVLRTALTRFGCCPHDHVVHLVDTLLNKGQVHTPGGHCIRMVAFGSTAPGGSHRYSVILLHEVVDFLRRYLQENWDVLHNAEFKDPAFGFLMTLEKAQRGHSPGASSHSVMGNTVFQGEKHGA